MVDILVMVVIANLIRDPCVRLLLIALGLPLLKGLQLRQPPATTGALGTNETPEGQALSVLLET